MLAHLSSRQNISRLRPLPLLRRLRLRLLRQGTRRLRRQRLRRLRLLLGVRLVRPVRRRRLGKSHNREVARKATCRNRKVRVVNRKRQTTHSLAISERPRRRSVLV